MISPAESEVPGDAVPTAAPRNVPRCAPAAFCIRSRGCDRTRTARCTRVAGEANAYCELATRDWEDLSTGFCGPRQSGFSESSSRSPALWHFFPWRGRRAGYPLALQEGHRSVMRAIASPHAPQRGSSGLERMSRDSGRTKPQSQRTAMGGTVARHSGQDRLTRGFSIRCVLAYLSPAQ